MRYVILAAFISLMIGSMEAQHGTASDGYFPMGYSGDTWTGAVAAVDEANGR
ncbi:MAG TPA: hypothetical protein VMP68_31950 [Candidatus Eisenbacteria bacterium]|nr:hypothetical protein [Candidatus Eisenbacteria bacterium]